MALMKLWALIHFAIQAPNGITQEELKSILNDAVLD